MSAIEFTSFGKIPRLFRDVVVSEKIDGTNAAIGINLVDAQTDPDELDFYSAAVTDEAVYIVYAQSRSRIITPTQDNHGFARWVYDNADSLCGDLGPGLHFGEWWGSGINRGYGLPSGEKRFSLFNTKRWGEAEFKTAGLGVVPVIDTGEFSTLLVRGCLMKLVWNGSYASPGYNNPEGVVVYHTAANEMFKATIKDDEVPKIVAAKRRKKGSDDADAVDR